MKQRSPGLVPPLLALAVSACSSGATPNPLAPPVEARASALAVRGESLAALRAALDDARTRVLPALADESASRRMGGTLEDLRTALAGGDAEALDAALESGRAALAAERSTLDDEGAAAELDALLVLFSALDEAVPASLQAPAAVN